MIEARAKKYTLNMILQITLVLFVIITWVFPPIRGYINYRPLTFICMFFWIILVLCESPNLIKKRSNYITIAIIYTVYTFVLPYLFKNYTVGNRYLEVNLTTFLYIAYTYNVSQNREDINRKIIYMSLPFILITSLITTRNLILHPFISRAIKSSGEDTFLILRQGIGGYEFIYFATIFIAILFYINFAVDKKDVKYKFLFLVFGVTLMLTVVLSNYFTALIMLISSIIMIFSIKLLNKKSCLSTLLFILVLFIFLLYWKNICVGLIDFITNYLQTGKTYVRLLELKSTILYGTANDLNTRADTYQNGFKTFFENPVLGLVVTKMYNNSGYVFTFGQHSHFLDTFSLYGIIGGFMQVYLVIKPFMQRLGKNYTYHGFTYLMFLNALVIYTANVLAPSIGYVLFFIYPTVLDYLSSKQRLT